ncbi:MULTISPECIES: lipid IV(A) 3-deoxy-D-manno-octulosonic acid transferase [unclassified Halomonas]|uniref:lipid IV(A) 3-deoxy-D-manno-octulosonic acid transferase n=1 Tax=unclassified Halomonas TaxID=2609666 RepID=UPI0007DA1025|nr:MULTISPECIES: lipid IV(A) 3-deoxy-D-manno-octulosonic acid transferase [unclassified Halomonas]MBT2787674.1 lipid IV(A) 3-deoxy-D-manno-octulosonic acid transferase [Halomonas sp. ISL-106]MBT2798943.1 lipid IV(A) 3-deoxy-D-manno-octulosonic acid transferase [Halomonas sp. ISL-104]OAL61619.1 3-deoxy-D-manno-octulosonic acid transferase [Halomonas sp. ALS9]
MTSPTWPRLAYSAALYALSPLIGWRIWREQVPTYSRFQRLGLRLETLPPAPRIWLHCASVGEVRAARPLIEQLLARYPTHSLLLTTMTATGAQQSQALMCEQPLADQARLAHRFLPLDFPGAAKRFVRRVKPELALLFETELWPNLIHACRQQRVPVAVVNGRLSPRAFKRYQRLHPLIASTLAEISWLAAKSPADAKRFNALGCSSAITHIVGSLKFELVSQVKAIKEGEHLLRGWGERPVWVAGSTREGEEALLLKAHKQLLQGYPDALLVLVPRHPQRFDEVAKLCQAEGWTLSRRSQQQLVAKQTQVYLGDTLGELAMLYTAGSVAFVGGSLVPLGGHNVLEPAALGRPVLSGASIENFADVAEPLQAAGALTLVDTPDGLAEAVAGYFAAPELAQQAGLAGLAAIEAHKGALARTLVGLEALLPQ